MYINALCVILEETHTEITQMQPDPPTSTAPATTPNPSVLPTNQQEDQQPTQPTSTAAIVAAAVVFILLALLLAVAASAVIIVLVKRHKKSETASYSSSKTDAIQLQPLGKQVYVLTVHGD